MTLPAEPAPSDQAATSPSRGSARASALRVVLALLGALVFANVLRHGDIDAAATLVLKIGPSILVVLVPFALAVYPAGRVADLLEGGSFAALGLCAYGAGFLLLRIATESQLLLLMPTLGLSSAVIFASAMRDAAINENPQSRVVAMSLLNSAGNLGMLLGTAIAGIASANLRAHGGSLHAAHALVFGLGGVVPLGIAALTLGAPVVAQRVARSVRVKS